MERERERYRRLRAVLRQVVREQRHRSDPRCTYNDQTVLLVALWAAVRDKPMCWAEQEAARHLIEHLPAHTRYVLADNNYDRNELYEQAGFDQHVQWMAVPRRSAKGLGHQQHSDWRLAAQPWLRGEDGRHAM